MKWNEPRAQTSKGKIPGSRRSTQGCILTCPQWKNKEPSIALGSCQKGPWFLRQMYPNTGARILINVIMRFIAKMACVYAKNCILETLSTKNQQP